ncbi:Acidic repeat-containing protein [Melipona quadrifasciata]|uniref:Acidic repeat-containing protein n=1 Tax=Melipona quadrifasciata TaxID=166423 RepID=A0A0N0U3W7_9HYME|nr:Acidic repeat-containing protein [Melipona quadrifasciata]
MKRNINALTVNLLYSLQDGVSYEVKYRAQNEIYGEYNNTKLQLGEKMEESFCNSQNFCLKLSQDSTISKSQKVNDDEDIVIISDTSSDSTCSVTKKAKSKSTLNKNLITYVIDSSDSDSTEITEKKYFQTWEANEKSQFGSNYQGKKDNIEKDKILYTSDESSCSSTEYIKDIISSSKTNSTYVSFTTDNVKSTSDTNVQSHSNVVDTNNSKNFNSNTQSCKTASLMNKNGIDFKKKLSQRDTKNIIKNIRSTRIIYESPKERNTAFEQETDDMIIHPAISPKNNLKANNESMIDSENDIIRGSQMDLANPYKTHISKFLSTTHIEKDRRAAYVELSERKRQQISKWLMANSPDSQITHKTIINESVQRTKNNVFERSTPKKSYTNVSTPMNPIMNKPQNVDIMECVNILDELYGKSWRDKADELFSKSEPRKQVTKTKNRAVQTDRKIINKERVYISDSDDDSDTYLTLQNPPIKRNVRKNIKQRDSFINDQTSSESEHESLYYTALTNPRVSTSNTQSKPSVPEVVQRIRSVCDTDSECEGDTHKNNQMFNIRGKMLSFSDESEDSNTSEFDPGDDVPPKPTIKKASIKTTKQVPKLNIQRELISNNLKHEKNISFLASLSQKIPLTDVHPDAKKYRLHYKNNKENLCNYLYKLYNEKVFDNKLPEDMSIEWNIRMRGTAGFCYNKKSVKTLGGIVKSSRIVLATKILDTPDRLRDTLIHEMCHAAAWLINGISDGHGPFWTKWANKAMETFPELPPIRRCHDYKIKTKFTYKCVDCGYSIGRHSKSLDIENKRCGLCYGKFELLLNKTTKTGIVQMQTPKREPSAFALYVKKNYSSVKKERNIKHAEVMKILGQQFSAIKIAKKQDNLENNSNADS